MVGLARRGLAPAASLSLNPQQTSIPITKMKRTVSTSFGAVLLVCASAVSALNTSNAASITPSVTGDAVAAAIGTRMNIAAAANGGVAFSSSDLGPAYASDRLNDGVIDRRCRD